MKKILISVGLVILSLFSYSVVVKDTSTTTLYFPTIFNSRTDGLGLYISDNAILWFSAGVKIIRPDYIRSMFGSSNNPYDTLYQHYLNGGWNEVDAEIVPDLILWRETSIPIVAFMYGGVCGVPTLEQLDTYALFISQAVERYNIKYFEVWNEPDAGGGLASLYGCFGYERTTELIYLIERTREYLNVPAKLGVSFMFNNPAQLPMYKQVTPYLDWIGVHHYGVWDGFKVQETWPKTIEEVYTLTTFQQTAPVFLTEFNLRNPLETCTDEAFIQAQLEYIQNALKTKFVSKIILVYNNPSDWQCTGIRGTPSDNFIKGYEEDTP